MKSRVYFLVTFIALSGLGLLLIRAIKTADPPARTDISGQRSEVRNQTPDSKPPPTDRNSESKGSTQSPKSQTPDSGPQTQSPVPRPAAPITVVNFTPEQAESFKRAKGSLLPPFGGFKKLDGRLALLWQKVESARQRGTRDLSVFSQPGMAQVNSAGDFHVCAHVSDWTAAEKLALADAGLRIEIVDEQIQTLQGYIP